MNKYLKNAFGPLHEGLFLATQLVAFSHREYFFPTKTIDQLSTGMGERAEVWISTRAKTKH